VPIAATVALAMIGPIPGTLTTGILACHGFDLARQAVNPFIEAPPIGGEPFDDAHQAWRQDLARLRQEARQFETQEARSLPYRDAALEQEGADLIDDARALTDQTSAYTMQPLQVELINRLGGDEPHCWTLHRLSNRLGVAKVVLLALRIRANVFRRHQASVMTKRPKPAAEVMSPDAGFHPDQTGQHIGQTHCYLATRPLLPQHNGAAFIQANV